MAGCCLLDAPDPIPEKVLRACSPNRGAGRVLKIQVGKALEEEEAAGQGLEIFRDVRCCCRGVLPLTHSSTSWLGCVRRGMQVACCAVVGRGSVAWGMALNSCL